MAKSSESKKYKVLIFLQSEKCLQLFKILKSTDKQMLRRVNYTIPMLIRYIQRLILIDFPL